ncbi:MAG: IS1595 family transposase [Caulobacterales bacterium]|uniref:IS1595 family transposase n=1 Tax=Glycocaulis sp. TaxID=1969725 RepID=UPI003FA15425
MAQHFLLSAASRTLSLKAIYQGGEEAAYRTFCAMRWNETEGEAVCPRCGCTESYDIATRRKFKCKGCHHQFSVTSGTIFASRKMSFTDLLAAVCLFVNGVKGMSALQMSRDLDCQYKTAFVMMHKLREALGREIEGLMLNGEVEIDGAYFGGHIRPANRKEDRIDRRKARHQTGTRRVVFAMRQRQGRTVTQVLRAESDGLDVLPHRVCGSAIIYADEASHWDVLSRNRPTGRINHSQAYSMDGAHTNNVESYFSRLRRMVQGQHHGVSPHYLYQYANEAAWKEDHRRSDNGDLANRTVRLAMTAPVSRTWAGYWQRS